MHVSKIQKFYGMMLTMTQWWSTGLMHRDQAYNDIFFPFQLSHPSQESQEDSVLEKAPCRGSVNTVQLYCTSGEIHLLTSSNKHNKTSRIISTYNNYILLLSLLKIISDVTQSVNTTTKAHTHILSKSVKYALNVNNKAHTHTRALHPTPLSHNSHRKTSVTAPAPPERLCRTAPTNKQVKHDDGDAAGHGNTLRIAGLENFTHTHTHTHTHTRAI